MNLANVFAGNDSVSNVHPGVVVCVLLALLYPVFASPFFVLQIAAYSLILGTIGLSLMMLAGYGGMVSLAQLTVAGIAGYLVAITGDNSVGVMGFGWPWWLTVPVAVLVAALASGIIGAIAVRTEGIYTIMITLAIAVVFFYFVRQNYVIFNGFTGFAGVEPPTLFGVYLRDPVPFYYLTLVMAAVALWTVRYCARSTYGLTLQAIRDNPRRMRSLGYDVTFHRIFAYVLSGVIAGCAGVLLVWFNGRISPGSIGVDVVIDILVITVVGGLRHPVGPFLGAIMFVLLENFAIDLIDRERFNTVIGIVFLLIVLFSPDGLLGLWQRVRASFARKTAAHSQRAGQQEHLARTPDGQSQ